MQKDGQSDKQSANIFWLFSKTKCWSQLHLPVLVLAPLCKIDSLILFFLPWSQSYFLPCTKNSWTKSRKLLTWNSHDYGGALDHLGWYLVGLKCLDESAWMSDETLPIKIWRKLDQPRNNWMHYTAQRWDLPVFCTVNSLQ